MVAPLPSPALPLGLAGLIPFLGLATGVWLGWSWAGPALAAYGATILAFLGAVHWGLALRAPPDEQSAEWLRLGLGVLPALAGWLALLLPLPQGLALLAFALAATALAETIAFRAGYVPLGYLRLRWTLTAIAATALFSTIPGL